jgi:hypothetical protein
MKDITRKTAALLALVFFSVMFIHAQADNKAKKYDPSNHGLVIIKKARVKLSKAADKNGGVNGTVRLRVTFLKTGEIGDIVFVSDDPPNTMAAWEWWICVSKRQRK